MFVLITFFCFAQKDSRLVVNRIGNKGASKPLSVEYEENPAHKGRSEVGTIIPIRKGRVQIVGARLLINKISMPDTALFILNIYEVKERHPTSNGLYRPVKIAGKIVEGQLNVDLSGYNIYASEDFLLAFSWPDGEGKISFGAGMGGSRSYHRVDNGEWERLPMMKLGFSVTVISKRD